MIFSFLQNLYSDLGKEVPAGLKSHLAALTANASMIVTWYLYILIHSELLWRRSSCFLTANWTRQLIRFDVRMRTRSAAVRKWPHVDGYCSLQLCILVNSHGKLSKLVSSLVSKQYTSCTGLVTHILLPLTVRDFKCFMLGVGRNLKEFGYDF